MKIYTKKGDSGETSILGGKKLPKHHVRLEAYGCIDELNSSVGFLRDQNIGEIIKNDLLKIQEELFTIGSHLASDKDSSFPLPALQETWVSELENKMDEMDAQLPELKNFILPGGHPAVSSAHMSRCICRRAERWTSAFNELEGVDPLILKYLNRLSDYFFMLSRKIGQDLKVDEIYWKPRN